MQPLPMYVNADSLHVREKPGADSKSKRLVPRKLGLEATGIDDGGLWAKVSADGVDGWCSLKYLMPVNNGKSPWLEKAQQEIGVKEIPGKDYHPRIYEYMASVDKLSKKDMEDDEGTAWCSCFINWSVEKGGLNGTNSAMAQSWKGWREGKSADSVLPKSKAPALVGDIAVGERESKESGKGHVAIFLAYDETSDRLLLLGGNQNNAVRYSWYPRESKDPYGRLLTLRSL